MELEWETPKPGPVLGCTVFVKKKQKNTQPEAKKTNQDTKLLIQELQET